MPEEIALLLALVVLGTIMAVIFALGRWASGISGADWSWLPWPRRARRLAEDAAYAKWKREGGGAWFDSWWNSPEATRPRASEGAAARPEAPGRMTIEEARRKLDALLELTVARGATPAEAATARAIAERLRAEYDLH